MVKDITPPDISIENFRKEERHSFLDYIRGGLCMNLVVGIDFTASNKEPHLPDSLHHIGADTLNLY